jgi:multiple sugar transport system permease protein
MIAQYQKVEDRVSDQRALTRRRITTAIILIALGVVAIIVVMPIVWTFSTSLRVPKESFSLPPKWLPTDFKVDNYAQVFREVPYERYILNSLIVSFASVTGQIITSTLAAYAFARLRFPFRNFLFVLLMTGLMVPLFVTIIPVFRLVSDLGLLDTLFAIIIPVLVTPFGIFLMRQFFLTIPTELEDAAKMDGAGPLRIFWYIFLPLGKPGIAVLAVLLFNAHWNDFFRPFIFLTSQDNWTITLGMFALRGPLQTGSIAVVLASVAMSLIPMIIIVVLAQRYLIEGIILTGTKG